MNEPVSAVRCAIYTRKSTEEGLEQQFNSLHAQREAAEAFILSQKQGGWVALPESYDDGGFSGASIERPAMKRLLAQVEKRAIDCVVVYKVDRLSRSLLDFARLMELFDRCGVSFVSVPQEFNSTTSLGRLTLNILLSFAQFEREIIGERTRDKPSAARGKGKGIGGILILGYDVDPKGGKLIVNPVEAVQVRSLYRMLLEAGCLQAAVRGAYSAGITSKNWMSSSDVRHGGNPLNRSSLRHLLSNVLYRGLVSHKGEIYPGEHEPIVEPQILDAAQQLLQANSAHLRGKPHGAQRMPLSNLLHCAGCNRAMAATYTSRAGRRHRYYVCRSKGQAGTSLCSGMRLPASDLEAALTSWLEPIVGNPAADIAFEQIIERVLYDGRASHISIYLLDGTRLEYTLTLPDRGGRRNRKGPKDGRVPRISRLMALAIKLQGLVRDGEIETFRSAAELGRVTRARMSQIMRLANLAPAIQEELLFLPKTITGSDRICERGLRRVADIVDWEQQQKLFRSLMDSASDR